MRSLYPRITAKRLGRGFPYLTILMVALGSYQRTATRVESEASSRRWAIIFNPGASDEFTAATDFSQLDFALPINAKEMIAVVRGFVELLRSRGREYVHGRRFALWLDNRAAVVHFTRWDGPAPQLTRLAHELFELEAEWQFTTQFSWWPSAANALSDRITREHPDADFRLHPTIFDPAGGT